ncbi:13314_t:CDS:2 [Acaulospora colombiana]|uniref:13314_t:CDS:1 n=1 Tax=Acaulospora colombiana TaxID=27376 RepID=A0ACA9JZQ0_9GLOM|nr:13314_t:CDS:2 [Acaulospora colombiana]
MLKKVLNRASSLVKKRNSAENKEEVVEVSPDGSTTTITTMQNGKPVKIVTQKKIVQKKPEDKPSSDHVVKSEGQREPVENRPPESHAQSAPKSPLVAHKARDPDEPDFDKVNIKRDKQIDPASKCAAIVIANEFQGHLDLTGKDFSKVDEYARATPNSKTNSVKHLAEYLIAPWNNELDKLRCIFTWITENISYDTGAYFSGDLYFNGAEDTLRTRKGVCEGYAGLFDALASVAGLKHIDNIIHIGVGYVPGNSIDSSQYAHAWNGTVYKGEFLLIDSTWGSGFLNGRHFEKRFEPFYFLCKPTDFIYSHLPDDPKQQYVSPPLTEEEFLSLTHVKPTFFASGLQFRKYYGNVIVTDNDQLEIEIARFTPDKGKPLHAVLEWKGQSIPVMIQRLVGYGDESGGRTKFEFSIFDLPEDEHPVLSLLTPTKQVRQLEKVSRCDDGSVTYALETCVDQKGEWNLVHSEKSSHSFNFVAQYVAE